MALTMTLSLAVPVRADLKKIEAKGVLRVVVSADESPEIFAFDDGAKPGFEREILEGFARLRKIRLEVVKAVQFEEVIPAILRGQADLATGIIDTEARRAQVAFTVEILPARLVLVGRGPRPPRDVKELGAVKVGTIQGTSWAETAAEAGVQASNIEAFVDMPSLLGALKTRKVSLAVMSLSDFVLHRRTDPDLHAGPFLGEPRSAAWALRKDDRELLVALNEYLENLRRTPSWGRMAVSYFGEDALALLGRAHKK